MTKHNSSYIYLSKRGVVAMIALLALFVFGLGLASAATSNQGNSGNNGNNGGNENCPAGTIEVAKFETTNAGAYNLDGDNNGNVVISNADLTGGDWSSDLFISAIVVKGGPDATIDMVTPPATSGTFSNANVPTVGQGNIPDISNIKFCAADPQPEPTLGSITLVKAVADGGDTNTAFTIGIDQSGSGGLQENFPLSDGQSRTFSDLPADTYGIFEIQEDGWEPLDMGDISCVSDGSSTFDQLPVAVANLAGGGNVELAAGDDVTCTFTNEFTAPAGDLVLQKVTNVATNDGFDFELRSGNEKLGEVTLTSGGEDKFTSLTPGTYEVEEFLPLGWTLDNAACNDVELLVIDNKFSVVIENGKTTTCVITNKKDVPPTGTIVIKKVTTNNDSTTPFTFSPTGFNSDTDFTLVGGQSSESFTVNPGGDYSILENSRAGWNLDSAICTSTDNNDDSFAADINVSADETVTCMFTNSFSSPPRTRNLEVTKYNDKNNNGQRENGENGLEGWTITVNPGNLTEKTDSNGVATFADLNVGTYTVCEEDRAGWVNTDPGNLCQTVEVVDSLVVPIEVELIDDQDFVSDVPFLNPEFGFCFPLGDEKFLGVEQLETISDENSVMLGYEDELIPIDDLCRARIIEPVRVRFGNFQTPQPYSISLAKVVTGDSADSSQSFEISIDSSDPDLGGTASISADGSPQRWVRSLAGPPSFSLMEQNLPANWSFVDLTCVNTGNDGVINYINGENGGNSPKVSFIPANGDDITCTWKNEFTAPTVDIRVIKYNDANQDGDDSEVSFNSNTGSTLTDWEFTVYDDNGNQIDQGTTSVANTGSDSGTRVSFSVPQGPTYTICETPQEGWLNSDPGNNSVADPADLDRPCKSIDSSGIQNFSSLLFGNYEEVPEPEMGSITIVKEVVTGDASTQFAFEFTDPDDSTNSFDLTGLENANDKSFSGLEAGVYEIIETFPSGEWEPLTAEDIVCTSTNDTSTFTFLPVADESDTAGTEVTLAAGDDVTCTFKNTEFVAKLIIKKEITGPYEGDPVDFNFSGSGDLDSSFILQGGGSKEFIVEAGTTYSVVEVTDDLPEGWSLESATCDNEDTPDNVTVAEGDAIESETVTCTFTNKFTPAPVNVFLKKVVTGDGADSSVNFSFSTAVDNNESSEFEQNADAGVVQVISDVPVGADVDVFEFLADDLPENWAFKAVECESTNGNTEFSYTDLGNFAFASFTTVAGDDVTCTFTNEFTAPEPETGTITIVKSVVEGDTNTEFDFGLFGPDVFNSSTETPFMLKDSESKSFTELVPGNYAIAEYFEPGWEMVTAEDVTCVDANEAPVPFTFNTDPSNERSGLTLALAAGDDITCAFTNTQEVPEPDTYELRLIKYNDLDEDGTNNEINTGAGESPSGNALTGWEFIVYDSNGNEVGRNTTSVENAGANGDLGIRASIPGLISGEEYTICETQQEGWINTQPGTIDPTYGEPCETVTLTSSTTVTRYFGNYQELGTLLVQKVVPEGKGDPNNPNQTFNLGVQDSNGGDLAGATVTAGQNPIGLGFEQGSYFVAESNLADDWTLTDISCVSDDQTSTFGNFVEGDTRLSVELAAGDRVVCTFTNEFTAPEPDPTISVNKLNDANEDATFTDNEETTPGATVTFQGGVTNTSAETLTIISITDDIHQDGIDNSTSAQALIGTTLAADQTAIFTFEGTIANQDDLTEINTLTVTAEDDDGNEASDSDTSTVTTPAAPECLAEDLNPHDDLEVIRFQKDGNEWVGKVMNNSTVCEYRIGLASYEMYINKSLGNQVLFDSDPEIPAEEANWPVPGDPAFDGDNTILPGEMLELRVDLPTCAYQIDLVFDASHNAAFTDSNLEIVPIILPEFGREDLYGKPGTRYNVSGEPKRLLRWHKSSDPFCQPPADLRLNLTAECVVGDTLYWRVTNNEDVDIPFSWGEGEDKKGIATANDRTYFTTQDRGDDNTTIIRWENPAGGPNSTTKAHNNQDCVYHVDFEKEWTGADTPALADTTILTAESSIATATCGYDANGEWFCEYAKKSNDATLADLEVPFGETYNVSEAAIDGWKPIEGVGEGFTGIEDFDMDALPDDLIYKVAGDRFCESDPNAEFPQNLEKFCTHTVVNEFEEVPPPVTLERLIPDCTFVEGDQYRWRVRNATDEAIPFTLTNPAGDVVFAEGVAAPNGDTTVFTDIAVTTFPTILRVDGVEQPNGRKNPNVNPCTPPPPPVTLERLIPDCTFVEGDQYRWRVRNATDEAIPFTLTNPAGDVVFAEGVAAPNGDTTVFTDIAVTTFPTILRVDGVEQPNGRKNPNVNPCTPPPPPVTLERLIPDCTFVEGDQYRWRVRNATDEAIPFTLTNPAGDVVFAEGVAAPNGDTTVFTDIAVTTFPTILRVDGVEQPNGRKNPNVNPCTPPPPVCEPDDLNGMVDLRVDRFELDGDKWVAKVTNTSEICEYRIGLASYEMRYNKALENQVLFDSDPEIPADEANWPTPGDTAFDGENKLGPGEMLEFHVDVPECAYQVDLVFDASHNAAYTDSNLEIVPIILPEFGRDDLYGIPGTRYNVPGEPKRLLNSTQQGNDYCQGELPMQVTSFTLVDAETDAPIAGYETLADGAQIPVDGLPSTVSILANTNPMQVGSVFLDLNGPLDVERVENVIPYALYGDMNGDIRGYGLPVGTYTITATPYTYARQGGPAGQPLTITFEVVDPTEVEEIVVEEVTEPSDEQQIVVETIDEQPTVEQPEQQQPVVEEPQEEQPVVEVVPENAAPVAVVGQSLTLTDTDNTGTETVTLDGTQSTDDKGITSYRWTLMDGTEIGTEAVIDYAFPVGQTPATLTVTDAEGETDAASLVITVVAAPAPEVTEETDEPEQPEEIVEEPVEVITEEPEQPEAPQPPAAELLSFTLVDAATGAAVPGFDPLTDGAVLDLGTLPAGGVNVRANVAGTFNDVNFELTGGSITGTFVRSEGIAPYALFGDDNGAYTPYIFTPGSYSMVATMTDDNDAPLDVVTINFTVVAPAPAPQQPQMDINTQEAPVAEEPIVEQPQVEVQTEIVEPQVIEPQVVEPQVEVAETQVEVEETQTVEPVVEETIVEPVVEETTPTDEASTE